MSLDAALGIAGSGLLAVQRALAQAGGRAGSAVRCGTHHKRLHTSVSGPGEGRRGLVRPRACIGACRRGSACGGRAPSAHAARGSSMPTTVCADGASSTPEIQPLSDFNARTESAPLQRMSHCINGTAYGRAGAPYCVAGAGEAGGTALSDAMTSTFAFAALTTSPAAAPAFCRKPRVQLAALATAWPASWLLALSIKPAAGGTAHASAKRANDKESTTRTHPRRRACPRRAPASSLQSGTARSGRAPWR